MFAKPFLQVLGHAGIMRGGIRLAHENVNVEEAFHRGMARQAVVFWPFGVKPILRAVRRAKALLAGLPRRSLLAPIRTVIPAASAKATAWQPSLLPLARQSEGWAHQ